MLFRSPGEQDPPHPLHDLLETGYAYRFFYNNPTQQAQMFQIVGGTDNLARAFARRLDGRIEYQAAAVEIRQDEGGVLLRYRQFGHVFEARGSYLVCAAPLTMLRDLPGDIRPEARAAMREVEYARTGKIGLQFKRRFWEEDERIFGGISWTDQTITQIMYPSTGFLGTRGVVVGSYAWDDQAEAIGKLRHAERVKLALEQGRKIHPQYDAEHENSFSVYWPKVPWTLGGWAEWKPEQRTGAYATLCRPDGRFHFAGEHLSYLTGWMAGALESARVAVASVHERAAKETQRRAG